MPEHLKYKTLKARYLLDTMEGADNRLNLVFLDACRDHPFTRSWFRGGEEGKQGLAPMQAPGGSLIAYATGANRRALDGNGQRNSPYTQHLKQEILKPGVSIFEMLTNVRVAVKKETYGEQEPAFYSNLDGNFCFIGPCGRVQVSTSPLTTTPTTPPQPGTVFRDQLSNGSLGPEMVMIPAGHFQMGDIQGSGYSDEQPVHEVSVAQFAMGRYEVTNAEFVRFLNAVKRRGDQGQPWFQTKAENAVSHITGSSGYFRVEIGYEEHPVTHVSWYGATAYAQWLSQQTQHSYRLPTEAEWEYAARAGSNTKYGWGNDIGSNRANCDNNYCGDYFEHTAPVGSFAANGFGLYDTLGNVWEWTCSIYENKYQGAEQYCASGGHLLALRGSSWNSQAGGVRLALRYRSGPTFSFDNVGVRLARDP